MSYQHSSFLSDGSRRNREVTTPTSSRYSALSASSHEQRHCSHSPTSDGYADDYTYNPGLALCGPSTADSSRCRQGSVKRKRGHAKEIINRALLRLNKQLPPLPGQDSAEPMASLAWIEDREARRRGLLIPHSITISPTRPLPKVQRTGSESKTRVVHAVHRANYGGPRRKVSRQTRQRRRAPVYISGAKRTQSTRSRAPKPLRRPSSPQRLVHLDPKAPNLRIFSNQKEFDRFTQNMQRMPSEIIYNYDPRASMFVFAKEEIEKGGRGPGSPGKRGSRDTRTGSSEGASRDTSASHIPAHAWQSLGGRVDQGRLASPIRRKKATPGAASLHSLKPTLPPSNFSSPTALYYALSNNNFYSSFADINPNPPPPIPLPQKPPSSPTSTKIDAFKLHCQQYYDSLYSTAPLKKLPCPTAKSRDPLHAPASTTSKTTSESAIAPTTASAKQELRNVLSSHGLLPGFNPHSALTVVNATAPLTISPSTPTRGKSASSSTPHTTPHSQRIFHWMSPSKKKSAMPLSPSPTGVPRGKGNSCLVRENFPPQPTSAAPAPPEPAAEKSLLHTSPTKSKQSLPPKTTIAIMPGDPMPARPTSPLDLNVPPRATARRSVVPLAAINGAARNPAPPVTDPAEDAVSSYRSSMPEAISIRGPDRSSSSSGSGGLPPLPPDCPQCHQQPPNLHHHTPPLNTILSFSSTSSDSSCSVPTTPEIPPKSASRVCLSTDRLSARYSSSPSIRKAVSYGSLRSHHRNSQNIISRSTYTDFTLSPHTSTSKRLSKTTMASGKDSYDFASLDNIVQTFITEDLSILDSPGLDFDTNLFTPTLPEQAPQSETPKVTPKVSSSSQSLHHPPFSRNRRSVLSRSSATPVSSPNPPHQGQVPNSPARASVSSSVYDSKTGLSPASSFAPDRGESLVVKPQSSTTSSKPMLPGSELTEASDLRKKVSMTNKLRLFGRRMVSHN